MRDGERITARQVTYVPGKYAEKQGTKNKSTHKMRKTYTSTLHSTGVPLDCIRELPAIAAYQLRRWITYIGQFIRFPKKTPGHQR